jgi:PAS domain S-box-containing protein
MAANLSTYSGQPEPMSITIRQPVVERANEAATLYRLTDRLYRAQSADDVYNAALDAITGALGCSRASILLFDEAGVMRFVAMRGLSDHYRKTLEGHTPWKAGHPDPEPIFVSDIDKTDEAEWVKTAIRNEGIRALGFIPLVVQGHAVGKFMTYYETPRSFADHEIELAVTISRQVGFSIERARSERARKAAEHELRESEERFRLMSEHAPVMIWMSGESGRCLHLNKLLRDFWGVPEENIAEFDWSSTMHPEDAPEIGRTMVEAIAKRRTVDLKGRYRDALGRWRILQTVARPRMSNGEFLGMIGVNIDITEREEAEAARRQAETHRELLIAELNHRVKNTLSVVLAIAHQTFKGIADDSQEAFRGRLVSLARSHDLLTDTHWTQVGLRELAAGSLQMQRGDELRVSLRGPAVLLMPRQAVSLSMALHELFTNAMKYGALSNGEGRVTLDWDWTEETPRRLEIRWREQDGPAVTPPSRSGFGSVLLQRSLKGDLNADVSLEFNRAGLVCVIYAPLAANPPSPHAK